MLIYRHDESVKKNKLEFVKEMLRVKGTMSYLRALISSWTEEKYWEDSFVEIQIIHHIRRYTKTCINKVLWLKLVYFSHRPLLNDVLNEILLLPIQSERFLLICFRRI